MLRPDSLKPVKNDKKVSPFPRERFREGSGIDIKFLISDNPIWVNYLNTKIFQLSNLDLFLIMSLLFSLL